jgi:CheY-like chemotaxis protein
MHTRPDVVVIEDDAAIRELIVEALGEEGYVAVGLLGGTDATPLIAAAPPRLILLDRHLGDCDAQVVLAALRATPFLASIPVVLMSASATVYEEALALGTAGALAKPFQLEALAACVATFLAQPPLS